MPGSVTCKKLPRAPHMCTCMPVLSPAIFFFRCHPAHLALPSIWPSRMLASFALSLEAGQPIIQLDEAELGGGIDVRLRLHSVRVVQAGYGRLHLSGALRPQEEQLGSTVAAELPRAWAAGLVGPGLPCQQLEVVLHVIVKARDIADWRCW